MKKYGWIPDLPDHRDFYYSASPAMRRALPKKVDLSPKCPPIYDQGQLGSCTANGICAAHQFEQMRQNTTRGSFLPSRLFVYYNERVMIGTVNEDSGAMIRDGIKSVVKQGVCPETEWPYMIEQFATTPPGSCYASAMRHQVLRYRRVVQVERELKACLASGHPVVFGWSVYESAESKSVMRTGVRPMPGSGERLLGGHCEMLVGYNDASAWWKVRGSWGTAVGDKGYFYMPYAYLVNADLAADFWMITLVEDPVKGAA